MDLPNVEYPLAETVSFSPCTRLFAGLFAQGHDMKVVRDLWVGTRGQPRLGATPARQPRGQAEQRRRIPMSPGTLATVAQGSVQ